MGIPDLKFISRLVRNGAVQFQLDGLNIIVDLVARILELEGRGIRATGSSCRRDRSRR